MSAAGVEGVRGRSRDGVGDHMTGSSSFSTSRANLTLSESVPAVMSTGERFLSLKDETGDAVVCVELRAA
jgi:hypothetical protein